MDSTAGVRRKGAKAKVKQAAAPLTFIDFSLDRRERRKATNKAIAHSMRVFRQREPGIPPLASQQVSRRANGSVACRCLLHGHECMHQPLHRPVRAAPDWETAISTLRGFDGIQKYMDTCYSFGAMTTVVRPAAMSEPTLYYAFALQCQSEINAIHSGKDNFVIADPTYLHIRGILLASLAKTSLDAAHWQTILTISLLCCATAVSHRDSSTTAQAPLADPAALASRSLLVAPM
jgi:hypothetical protein